jgi:hypothetical protein
LLKNRPVLLTLVCLALGALVLLDNSGDTDGIVEPIASLPQLTDRAGEAPDASGASAKAVPAGKRLTNPLAHFDKSQLEDWSARPLFAPSRQRPPKVAMTVALAPPPPPPPPPSYDLLGVLRAGDRAIALLSKKGEGTSFRVEVGDTLGGWRIAEMTSASVVLKRNDGTIETVSLGRN